VLDFGLAKAMAGKKQLPKDLSESPTCELKIEREAFRD
jgi:hypothetical protein